MKRIICQLLIFCALPIPFIILIDLFFRNQDSLYSVKYEGAFKSKDSIEIIILGNSHANFGVNPTAFSLYTYNLANVNQSIYFDKRIMLHLLDSTPKLKYVLLSVDYHSLYFSTQGIRDNWSYYGNGIKYKNQSYLLANISPFLFGYTPKIGFALMKKKVRNYYTYGSNCLQFDVEEGVNLQDTLKKGFITSEGNNKDAFSNESMQARADYFTEMIRQSDEKAAVIYDLENLIKTLQEKNINVILFSSPTYAGYNNFLDPSIADQNTKDIRTLCDKYNLQYWDFITEPLFVQHDFYNADHLNKTGAHKFSMMLNDSINKIEARSQGIGLAGN
ncbi:MAG: hypothetical protein ABJB11_17140 [Ferruginibacter sp.]